MSSLMTKSGVRKMIMTISSGFSSETKIKKFDPLQVVDGKRR
jgi:hypothetical protein